MNRRTFLQSTAALAAAVAGCTTSGRTTPPFDAERPPDAYDWATLGVAPQRTSAVADPVPTPAATEPFTPTDGPFAGTVRAPPTVDGDGVYVAAGSTAARFAPDGEPTWRYDDVDGRVAAGPSLGYGSVHVASNRAVYALDERDGRVAWTARVGANLGPNAAPAIYDERVAVPSAGRVVALDAEDGSEAWTLDADAPVHGLAFDDQGVVAATAKGVVAATADGDRRWERRDLGAVHAAPAVTDDAVFVAADRTLAALARSDGATLWTASVEPGVAEPPAVSNGAVYVSAGKGSHAVALDADAGDRLWAVETGLSDAAPVAGADTVLFAAASTGFTLVDDTTGAVAERVGVHGSVTSQPVVGGRTVYYVDDLSSTLRRAV